MNHEGRNINQRNAAIIDAWVRLYICITTNDINEFYKALSGNVPRRGVRYYNIKTGDDYFVLYPYRNGKPFIFEKEL